MLTILFNIDLISFAIYIKEMRRKPITIIDDIALSKLRVDLSSENQNLKPGDWIRLLRTYLRMTQAELAKRANITQANLVAIESGKADSRVSTIQRIYKALSSNLRAAESTIHLSVLVMCM